MIPSTTQKTPDLVIRGVHSAVLKATMLSFVRSQLLVHCVLFLLLPACDRSENPAAEPETSAEETEAVAEPAEPPEATEPTTDAARSIEEMSRQAAFHRERFEETQSWLDMTVVAGMEKTLARLTGRFEHYGAAEDAMAVAFGLSENGPMEAAMKLDFTMHRFPQVERYLEQLSGGLQIGERPNIVRDMRADLAFAQGDYTAAVAAFTAAVANRRSAGSLIRLAAYHAQTGHPVLADTLFLEAANGAVTDRDFQRATMELQRGLLDLEHERYEEAKAHYTAANQAFDGWYLVQEHLAEVHCLLGECERAGEIYQDVIARTESPELMAAYGDVLEELGQADEAEAWRVRADARYEVLLARFPEALGGHGLEYFLARGPAPRALELAEQNAELRADGEALSLLAQAYLGVDRVSDAQATIERLEATPYSRPSYHALAATVWQAAGDQTRAEAHRTRRTALMAEFATRE